MTRVCDRVRGNGREIPFPIRTVHHQPPTLLKVEQGEIAGREEQARVALGGIDLLREHLSDAEIASLSRDVVVEPHLPG